jgi:TldD protein
MNSSKNLFRITQNSSEILEAAAEKAKKILPGLNCTFAEVRLAAGVSTDIQLTGPAVDSLSTGESSGGSVRVLKNGNWGFVTFNSPDKIEARIHEALRMAQESGPNGKSAVTLSGPSSGSYATIPLIDPADVPLDEKVALITAYNNIIASSPGIQTTRAAYRDAFSNYIYLNTEGSDLRWRRVRCGAGLTAIAKDGAVIQPYGNSTSGYGGFELVKGLESFAEKVASTAAALLNAESLAGGRYNVIIDPKLAGVFIHEAFGHLSEADFIHENPAMQKVMQLGRVFGGPELNVTDRGDIEGASGYIPFDDEGVMPQNTSLIKNGVLAGRLHSRETSAAMNEPLTGNGRAISTSREPIVRMTCTCIEGGTSTLEELFESAGDGIYAADYTGGQTDLEMFTFSPACAWIIKNGKKDRMVKNITLSGNVFTTLKSISKIAGDMKVFSGMGGCGKGGQFPLPVSFGGPHLLINDLLVGGGG